MSLSLAFWDSSALIPLCVEQTQTELASRRFANFRVVVWWATPVEIISGLARLLRMGQMSQDEFQSAKRQAETIAAFWMPIKPSAGIAAQSCSLLEKHPLTAADALQLAAALAWCEGKPQGKVFLSFDQRLKEAAGAEGFALE